MAASASTSVHSDDAGPPRSSSLLAILTYQYNLRDTSINAVTLVVILIALIVATAIGTLTLSALFWLPFALLIILLECFVALLTHQEGFSFTWCALAGLMLYEQLRWRVFSRQGSVAAVAVAIAAAVACVASLIYYLIEEVFWLEPADLSGLRGAKRAACTCYDRVGTTMIHLLGIGIGAGAAAIADAAHPSRNGAFYVVLGLGVLLLVLLPLVMRHRNAAGAKAHSRVAPAVANLSTEDLAVANLQVQLQRTRDEISRLTYEEAKRELGGEAADGVVEPADSNAPSLEALKKREATLIERLAEKKERLSA